MIEERPPIEDRPVVFSNMGQQFVATIGRSVNSPTYEMRIQMRDNADTAAMSWAEKAAHLASAAKKFADDIRKGYA